MIFSIMHIILFCFKQLMNHYADIFTLYYYGVENKRISEWDTDSGYISELASRSRLDLIGPPKNSKLYTYWITIYIRGTKYLSLEQGQNWLISLLQVI